MVDELFDETKRDSAIGRIGTMLERYFDGDASKLALLLDPTRLHSPMHQFRQEITAGFKRDRGAAVGDRGGGRRPRRRTGPVGGQGRRLRGPARAMLADMARGAGDLLDRTGAETGERAQVQEGRLRADRRPAGRARLRPAGRHRGQGPADVDAGDARRAARGPENRARGGRGSSSSRRPTPRPGSRRSTVVGDDVYCVVDPEAPEPATLEAAVRLARLLALASAPRARGRDGCGGDRRGP